MTGPGVDPRPEALPDGATEAVRFLADALADSAPGGALRIVTVPAPVAAPEPLLDGDGPALFWTTPGRPIHVGLGVTATVAGAGTERFREVRRGAERLWSRVDARTHPGTTPLSPRLFGGFSFLPGPTGSEWKSFGEASFVLPRLLYTVDGEGARLSVALDPSAPGADPRRLLEDAGALLDRLGSDADGGNPAAPSPERPPAPPDAAAARRGAQAPDDRGEWERAVGSIQRRIEAGRAEKIVAARSRAVALAGGAELSAILRRLELESETAARFAFRTADAVFVGATPERLVGRNGREVRTEALAGSVSADSPALEAQLLASLKDEAEHAYVVRAIEDALAPLCETLDRPGEPRIQRLRHVLHLQTPFVGRLRERTHILELVERLHPTPAVGGWPTDEALDWIRTEESMTRGWYAAPVGWLDDRGDGEFGVALRSGLLHEDRAHLYAGAGIVRRSDAAAEYDETEIKLRTMMDALGIVT